jgi:hypothetical protein
MGNFEETPALQRLNWSGYSPFPGIAAPSQCQRSIVVSDALAAFISYSREDSEFALRLAEDLKAAGAGRVTCEASSVLKIKPNCRNRDGHPLRRTPIFILRLTACA